MTELSRCERTSRLLVARLDALASVASQLSNAEAERLVELASIATMHAVALETNLESGLAGVLNHYIFERFVDVRLTDKNADTP